MTTITVPGARSVRSGFVKGGRRLGRMYLEVAAVVWRRSSTALINSRPVQAYGNHLHRMSRQRAGRDLSLTHTFFFRNRPQLELIVKLLNKAPHGSTIDIAVVGWSNGAEIYSISYAVRRERPDVDLRITGLDVSRNMVEFARRGVYRERNAAEQPSSIFERTSAKEMEEMFTHEPDGLSVKEALRRGVSWRVADATDERLVEAVGIQDFVIANNFLCHMQPNDAEKCLRNISRLVAPGGHLIASGIDLEVRSKVARDLDWIPITDSIHELHEGDPSLRAGWPFEYWGLEPLNPSRADWRMRYASVFRVVRTRSEPAPGIRTEA